MRLGTRLQPFTSFIGRSMAVVKYVLVFAVLLSTTAHAYSQLFDWSVEGWSPNGTGSLPRTYTDVGGRGIDVVVDIAPVNRFIDTTPQEDGANGLETHCNFDDMSESTTFTFSFFETGTTTPAGVNISDLTTKDLDEDTYQDAITFAAIPLGGGASIAPSQIQLYLNTNLTLVGSDTVHGSGTVGVTDVEGWATAVFSNQLIQSFIVEYHNGPNADSDPDQQWMWISDFTFSSATDFGDAPVSYVDVSHEVVSTLYIGPTRPDNEGSTQGNDGVGDDNDGNNDEDGVTFTASGGVTPQEVSAQVSVLNDTGTDAYACAWLDENLDGDFDASEARSCVPVADNNGSPTAVNFTWTGLPETQGTTYARFRLCSDLNTCSGPNNTPTITTTASETVTGSDIFPDGSGTSCVTPVVKTFTIVDSFTISDVDLTLNITHTYRGDFNIFLQSPLGTVVNLTTRGSVGSADNINVVFDDEAATNYVDDNSDHSPPPVPRVPENLLGAFDGEVSDGTWTLSMCDSWGSDRGNFDSATLDIFGPSIGGPALTGEVEDYRIDFDFRPTAVTIGKIDLEATMVTDFLAGLGVEQMNKAALLALLQVWDPTSAEALLDTSREEILAALHNYLDPDGDSRVAVLAWDTLEERGTIGFYVDRRQGEQNAWARINNDMLPGLINAPMGGEYRLADPGVTSGGSYQYRLIEQEAWGTTRTYGPFDVEMP